MTIAKAWGIENIPELVQALNNMCTGNIAEAIKCFETYLNKYTTHNYVDTTVDYIDVVREYNVSDVHVRKAIRDLWQFATRPKRNGQPESDINFIWNAIEFLQMSLINNQV